MTKNCVLGAVLAVALAVPAAVLAHEGHAHKVMGTVSAIQQNQVELKTPDGKTVTVVLNEKTTFARGKQKVDRTAVKVGERMVAEVASEKAMIATAVTLAAPRATATK
jgi:hypothetical protein